MTKKHLFLGLTFLSVAAAAGGLGYAAGAKKAGAMTAAGEIVWADFAPGMPLKVAKLWGDRDKGGDYAMLLKFPPGFEPGMHSHTADYQGVAIQGTWTHTFEDGTVKELPAGSLVYQPGKQPHNDGCKGTTDCIILIHQVGKGDFIPVKTAATTKEK